MCHTTHNQQTNVTQWRDVMLIPRVHHVHVAPHGVVIHDLDGVLVLMLTLNSPMSMIQITRHYIAHEIQNLLDVGLFF